MLDTSGRAKLDNGYQLNTLTFLGTYLRSGEPEGSPLHMHKDLDVGVELQLHPNQIPTL